jgi:hypothetical protein
MASVRPVVVPVLVAAALVVVALAIPAASQAPARAAEGRPGDVLRVMQREEVPQGFGIHKTATTSTVWPASPGFNNLVVFERSRPSWRCWRPATRPSIPRTCRPSSA